MRTAAPSIHRAVIRTQSRGFAAFRTASKAPATQMSVQTPTPPASASVTEVTAAINAATSERGGVYAQYSCCSVSWDDACRGTVGGALSSIGPNITDSRLWAKDGTLLYTVRTNNWNEKLGSVSTDDVALVVGNHNPGDRVELQPITLHKFLKQAGTYGGYVGLPSECDLSSDDLDKEVSIRFQTTFLPVNDTELSTMEFCTEAYNYQTLSKDDPRNVLLLCTTQGTAVQQDGPGAQKLFHHAVDPDGKAHMYWLEAERSKHKVGGQQVETKEEAAAAAARGKATSSVIGIKAMGTRFNVLMTIQLPVKQKERPRPQYAYAAASPAPMATGGFFGGFWGAAGGGGVKKSAVKMMSCAAPAPAACMMAPGAAGNAAPESDDLECLECASEGSMDYMVVPPQAMPPPPPPPCPAPMAPAAFACGTACPPPFMAEERMRRAEPPKPAPRKGSANAARVSRGSHVGVYEGVTKRDPARDLAQHPTITCIIFNTVAGGIPSVEDVAAAIDDMEALYAATGSGRLADEKFDFMKTELTVKAVQDVVTKVVTQPYTPAAGASNIVANASVFPE